MSVAPMKRLSLYAINSDSDAILTGLMKLKCVELSKASCVEHNLLPCELTGEINTVTARLSEIRSSISSLEKYSTKKFTLFKPKLDTDREAFINNGSYDKALDTVKYVNLLKKDTDKASADLISASERAAELAPWLNSSIPLDFKGTSLTAFKRGTLPLSAEADGLNKCLEGYYTQIYTISEIGDTRYVELHVLKEYEDKALKALSPMGYMQVELPYAHTTAKKLAAEAEAKAAEAKRALEALNDKMKATAREIDNLRILCDIESSKLETARKHELLVKTESVEYLSGWVPQDNVKKLSVFLDGFECAYDLTEPDTETDDPPVLLKNNAFASSFEWVIGMYSYPKYGTYDPSFIMGIFYCILFGMMFADAIYGLIFVLAAFVGVPLLKIKGNLKKTIQMFGYCGISCIVMGILFGGYAGDLPLRIAAIFNPDANFSLALLIDPVKDPLSFLIISLIVGAAHLISGMLVQFVLLCREGKWFDAVCDVGLWWVIFAGLGMLAVIPSIGVWITVIGFAAKIILGGRHEKKWIMKPLKGLLGLYDIINYGSDLLSYSRILALGLASSIIGQVINIICTMIPIPIVSIIMLLIVGVFGHVVNIGLNALGAFVHTSRLQYIEFFGKFYADGGRKFEPLVPVGEFTNVD